MHRLFLTVYFLCLGLNPKITLSENVTQLCFYTAVHMNHFDYIVLQCIHRKILDYDHITVLTNRIPQHSFYITLNLLHFIVYRIPVYWS